MGWHGPSYICFISDTSSFGYGERAQLILRRFRGMIRHIAEYAHDARDWRWRINTALLALFWSASLRSGEQEAPIDIVERFYELDAQGKQSIREDWRELARLVAKRSSRQMGRIRVIRDFVLTR